MWNIPENLTIEKNLKKLLKLSELAKEAGYNVNIASPNTDVEMNEWEKRNDVKIPEQYRDFLLFTSHYNLHFEMISMLNELAEELSRLSLGDFVKLKAVMEAENITEISETIDCIKRLPEYDFHRNICDESDFGREYLMRNLPTDFRISALDGVDFFDFGLKITQLSGSAVTSYGAVSGRGQKLYSALTVQPAEEECETEELEIGGMSL